MANDTQPFAGQNRAPTKYKVSYPTPRTADEVLMTALESNIADYASQLYGTPPPENTNPDKLLCQQIPVDWNLVQRLYASDLSNEQVYNFSQGFSGDSASHPIFIRDFIVRRSNYARASNGATLAGLYLATVTAAGSDYTQDTVSASLAGGTGSGGAVTPIVSNGAVVQLVITAIGTYTAAPNITINTTGPGTGATGTVAIQPATAVLVKEEELRLGPENYRDSLWVLVRRTYETLPGPWLPFTRYDDNLGPIQGQRRAVVNTGQVSTLTSTLKTTYEARDGSSYVSWEIQEAFGAGVSGFSAYPIIIGESLTADVRGRIVGTSSTIVASGTDPESGSLIISSVVKGRNNQIADRTTVSIASLPPDEVTAYWDWVSLPLCVLDITHTIYCNESSFATLVTNYDTEAGSSVLRKHRRTTSYVTSPPDTTPNLSGAAFETADLRYQGKVISFSLSNVLNDAVSHNAEYAFSTGGSSCAWTEAYDFSATSPSATTFLAGAWYTKSLRVEPFGQSMWKLTKEEYYSASGNPAI